MAARQPSKNLRVASHLLLGILLLSFLFEILIEHGQLPLPLKRGDVFTFCLPIVTNLLIVGAVLDGAIGYGRPPSDANLVKRASQPVKFWVIISLLFILFNGVAALVFRKWLFAQGG
jgi:hypothetical protein